MTVREAILKSLEEISNITNYEEVCNHIINNHYYDFSAAKTPKATVSVLMEYDSSDFITNNAVVTLL